MSTTKHEAAHRALTPDSVSAYHFITIPAAARELGISPRLLRSARDRGELVVYRLGARWERTTLANCHVWIRAARVNPTAHAERRVAEILGRAAQS